MNSIEKMSADAIRVLSADAIQKAKSGHPGLPLGAADAAYALWAKPTLFSNFFLGKVQFFS